MDRFGAWLCWKLYVARFKAGVKADIYISYFFVAQERRLRHFVSEFFHAHQGETNGVESISKNLAFILNCQWNGQTLTLMSRPLYSPTKKYHLLSNQCVT